MSTMPRYTMGLGPPAVTPGTWCPGGGAKRSDGKRVDSALLHIVDIFHRGIFTETRRVYWHLPRHTGNCVTDAVLAPPGRLKRVHDERAAD